MQICVFCASGADLRRAYVDCAHSLGTWIGAQGHTLVWGGCNVGLMNVVGEAVRAAGGPTIAVIPEFLVARGLAFERPTKRVVTPDLAERKSEFRNLAQAFVALPGGVGTWEEILEVMALRKLGQTQAPLVLVNVEGYYDPLLLQIERSIAEGFSPRDLLSHLQVAPDAAGVAAALEDARP